MNDLKVNNKTIQDNDKESKVGTIETISDAKKLMSKIGKGLNDPTKIASTLKTRLRIDPKTSGYEEKKLLNEFCLKACITFELETHMSLSNSAGDDYQHLAFSFCEELIQEYRCDSSSKKAVAEMATSAFIRYLKSIQHLNSVIDTSGYHSYISTLSKEIDRAHRQFISLIALLKQLSSPEIALKINTKNTFISQNQQVNIGKKDGHNEINESK